jgi:hypothetical protein
MDFQKTFLIFFPVVFCVCLLVLAFFVFADFIKKDALDNLSEISKKTITVPPTSPAALSGKWKLLK